jgi:ferredoxin-thioredoxin reductase catalytic subunit
MRIKLNPNKEIVNKIRDKLKETNGYCPCVNPKFWSKDTKCMCKNFIEDIDEGECHCGLYIKEK